MTLPEFVTLGERSDPDVGASLRAWAAELTASRTAREYLTGDVEEIVDPTGSAPRAFEAAVVAMESQCRRAAELIAYVASPTE